jgi:multiple sugar transport system ATP-binding protein
VLGGVPNKGIRRAAITEKDGADRISKAVETMSGRVELVEPVVSDTFVLTHFGGKEVTARMRVDGFEVAAFIK